VSDPIEGNIYFTGAWGGEWNVLLTFRDCNSEDVIVVEDIVDVICPSDTLRLDFTRLLDECEGVVDDSRMSASCEYAYTVSGCTIRVSFAITIEREGDLVAGNGIWSTATSGNCNGIYSLGCETIEVAGSRTGPVPASCDTLSSGFLSRLSARPASLLRALESD
jgi:hypothetical protein